ncbi:MAG TPA: Do family serine endopeptidase [Bryobacteraceae bacterium]|nr:Do family serine endopeptidase [Bryobacteraceae bacterium]
MRSKLFVMALLLAQAPLAVAAASAANGGQPYRISLQAGFAPVVKRCLPAVVNVSSSKIIRTQASASPFLSDPFFQQFFGSQFLRQFQVPSEERELSLGSGVIVSPDGYILTNNHVIDGATHVKVALADQREFEARIVGKDAETDIAVLKVDAQNLPTIPFGDSTRMQPGDFVLAIGDPFGLSQTVTMGIVSAVGRGNLGIEDYEDFIQTDAAINPGNSGGALINGNGQLIGINTAILSGESGGNQGVGFAIPIDMARQVMDQIVRNGRVARAWLGVTTQPVTPEISQAFGLSGQPYGALVGDVTANSPAAQAGLATGDIILEINGHRVPDSNDLNLSIAMMAPGTAVRFLVLRNGAQQEIPVTLGEEPAPPQSRQTAPAAPAQPAPLLDGVQVENLTPDIAAGLGLPPNLRGVVVAGVDSASLAAAAGLQEGDVIEQVNRTPVASMLDFRNAVRAAGQRSIILLVNHGGTTRFLVITPE